MTLRTLPFYPTLARLYNASPLFSKKVYLRPLVALVKKHNFLDILEVGAKEGDSCVVWAKLSPHSRIHAIDWFQDEGQEAIFDRNVKDYPNIHKMKGNSNDVLPALNGVYDFIFIDGGHSYSQTRQDIENSLGLLPEGGILAGDDLELLAEQVDQNYMNEHCEEDVATDPTTGIKYHPGVTKAIAEIGPVTKSRVFWMVQKQGDKLLPL